MIVYENVCHGLIITRKNITFLQEEGTSGSCAMTFVIRGKPCFSSRGDFSSIFIQRPTAPSSAYNSLHLTSGASKLNLWKFFKF